MPAPRASLATMGHLLLLCAVACEATTAADSDGDLAPALERQAARPRPRPQPQPIRPPYAVSPGPFTTITDPLTIQLPNTIAEPARGHAKLKKKKKLSDFAKKYWPLLLIPLAIQAKVIPLVVFKLKLLALKAILIGKLALLVIAINALRNAIVGTNDEDQQYSEDHGASEHYGYNGGPEFGAWINRRRDVLAFRPQKPVTAPTELPYYDSTTYFSAGQTAWPSP